jgi:nucleotide-binding universal stress UspA family protein
MKILLAVDGSKYATAAVLKCCEIISIDDEAEIKIVSVADINKGIGTDPVGAVSEFYLTINNELARVAENYVADSKKLVKEKIKKDLEIETKVLKGSPKVEIIEEAKNWGADLIVVGSHGYGFFERMLIGSVSNAILHHAPCSVLVVRVKDFNEEN